MVTIIVLQFPIVCAVQWGQSSCQLSIGDQSKIMQTSERQKGPILLGNGFAATAITSEISRALTAAAQLNGGASSFPTQMGVVFSQLILNRRSTDNRYSGHLKPSRPSCRSVNSARPATLDNMPLIGPGLPLANFAMGQMAGMALYRWRGAIHRLYLPGYTCQRRTACSRIALDANSDIRSAGSAPILVRHRRPPSWAVSSLRLSSPSVAGDLF